MRNISIEDPMAKRGGKAATRRSRQRRGQRSQPAPPAQPSRPIATPAEAEELRAADVAPSPDAFEKADAELRASTPPPGSRAEPAVRGAARARPQPRDYSSSATGPSRLTERAVAEYHYVARDLRNIAVLTVVLAVLLAVSAVVVNLLGIGAA